MKRTLTLPALLAFLSIFASGCSIIDANHNSSIEYAQTGQMMHSRCVAMIKAFQNNDYTQLRQCLPPELTLQFTEEKFRQSRNELTKTLGELVDYSFLAELKAPVFRNLIYKVKFRRIGNDQKPIEQEVLFRVMLAQSEGKIQVISFVFF